MGYSASQSARLDATFAALADPTRRAILSRLAAGEASVTDLARPFSMSQPAVSKHLKVLERAGLISRGRDAQRRPCRIEAKPLADADAWLENYRQFWEANFDRLEALLEELKARDKSQGEPSPAPHAKSSASRSKTSSPQSKSLPRSTSQRSIKHDRRVP